MNRAEQTLAGGFPSLLSMSEMLRKRLCSSVELTEYALRRIGVLISTQK